MKDSRRCTAKLSDGSRRCRNAAIKGGVVCPKHGGGAPQVRRSARARLAAMVEPALDGLQAALDSGDVRATIAASRIVLDRAGFGPSQHVDVTMLSEQQGRIIADVIVDALNDLDIRDAPEVRAAVGRALRRVGEADAMRTNALEIETFGRAKPDKLDAIKKGGECSAPSNEQG